MRALLGGIAALTLAGCASTDVALLPGEDEDPAGAVVELDRKTQAERRVVSEPDAKAATRYASLTSALPPRATRITLYFLEGTTTLSPASQTELGRLQAEVAKRPGAEVQITGHTDTVGALEDNDALSIRRAREIRDALVQQGLNMAITRAVGRGERELLVPTADNVEEARNRRVEVIIR